MGLPADCLCLVLNLVRAPQRLAAMQQKLSALGIAFTRIEGVDGATLPADELARLTRANRYYKPLRPGEVPMMKKVRFRTLGCYPLTGAVESEADTLPAIIQEMLLTKTSERQGRVIDHDSAASMEKKKQEGYF